MSAARLFDTYIAVDWSARSVPSTGADSIWIATLDVGASDVVVSNPATRHVADHELRAAVGARSDRRVLLGIDVALGYPAGTAGLLGAAPHPGGSWRAMWSLLAAAITDDARNRNNRFEVAAGLNRAAGAGHGPFWGCPAGAAIPGLSATKPACPPLPELRATERTLRAAGRTPMSVWQLFGAGSVGGQSLTAIPVLHRWLDDDDLGTRTAVWPFAVGLLVPDAEPGAIVVAEVWPTAFDPPLPAGIVRDAAQVAHVVRRMAAADDDGELTSWFSPTISPDDADRIGEEGWILGPGDAPLLR